MRITEVAVSNYRSIESLTRFRTSELTTLIGPNNEGKSNLLRALGLGIRAVRSWGEIREELATRGTISGPAVALIYDSFSPRRRAGNSSDIDYDWRKDYPLRKQTAKSPKPAVIKLTFQLDDAEKAEFKDEIGFATNGDLPIELQFSRTTTSIRIVKQGPGSASYKNKAARIAKFVSPIA